MTLIVSYISHQGVILASDRRITWVRKGVSDSYEDSENKAIVLAGTFLMGYTGFARLGGVKTEQWVCDQLGSEEPSNYFKILAQESTEAVAALGQETKDSGHAFVAVGFANTPYSPDKPEPVGVTISNALGESYGSWEPGDKFKITRTSPLANDNDIRLNAVGIAPRLSVIERPSI